MKKRVFFFLVLCSVFALASLAHAHKPHEHGRANMNIAVDGAQVTILLESPLTDLLSFGHAPATPEQRAQAREMVIRMHQEELFRLTPAAECRLERVALASELLDADLLDPNIPFDPDKSIVHCSDATCGDLDGEFVFMCGRPENLNSVDVLFFSAWPKIKRIRVQAVTPSGQRSANLTPRRNQVTW